MVGGDDCDDGNGAVNPGVQEICGDAIDNNCDTAIDEGCVHTVQLSKGLNLLAIPEDVTAAPDSWGQHGN